MVFEVRITLVVLSSLSRVTSFGALAIGVPDDQAGEPFFHNRHLPNFFEQPRRTVLFDKKAPLSSMPYIFSQ